MGESGSLQEVLLPLLQQLLLEQLLQQLLLLQ